MGWEEDKTQKTADLHQIVRREILCVPQAEMNEPGDDDEEQGQHLRDGEDLGHLRRQLDIPAVDRCQET